MNRIVRISLATGLLSVAALGASAANAQTFGHVSVNIGLPGPSLPVHVVRPAPVVVEQPVQRVWGPPPAHYGHDHGHYRQDRGHYRQERGYHGHDRGYYRDGRGYYGTRWDRDGDGVPNRHDSRPMNPYRY
ncbi:MAG TPA: hypothetical protein VLJ19_06545 [Variovorax sp.]|nr:hypothetical protein [Variovorax sp.]